MKFAKNCAKRTCALVLILLAAALQTVSAGQVHNVTVLQHTNLSAGPYSSQMTLSMGSTRQQLLLNRSQVFSQSTFITDGPLFGSKVQQPVLSYQGKIENIANSWVRLTTAGDYVSGVIDTGTERLYVSSESAPATNPGQRWIQQHLHAIDHAIRPPPQQPSNQVRETRDVIQITVNNGSLGQQDVTRVARIAIVVDTLYDEALGGRGLAQAISTINTVDGLYQKEFGLALKVETAIIITDTETLDLGNISLEENLARFRDYRLTAEELDPELGLVHLFTGVMTTDPSVGLAYIGAACRNDGYDISMSTPFEYPVLLTAHEIGHNLGALHDDETELCKLTTDNLMFSHISSLSTNEFSNCSVEAINKRLSQSACHLNAIDLSLTLSRTGDSSAIALITNTDTLRSAPSALLNLQLTNANVASAPANCEIDSTRLSCRIPIMYPGDSHSMEINFRFDNATASIVDASLEAIGFIDVNSINNQAQITVAAQSTENQTPVEPTANNDETDQNTTTSSAEPTPVNLASANGGGAASLYDLLMLLAGLLLLTGVSSPAQQPRDCD